MRELKTTFIGKGQVRGFEFTQVKKTEFGYIYKVDTKNTVCYEVFQKKENSRYNCISYPSNKAFGVWAWTYNTLEKAESKLEGIEYEKLRHIGGGSDFSNIADEVILIRKSFNFLDGDITLGKECKNG